MLDPDRLFPAHPRTRALARDLHASVEHAPILSPHGHVDPALIAEDAAFGDPAELLVRHDHYVTRLLHAGGADLRQLVEGTDPRAAWRAFVDGWHLLTGTASGYWITHELAELFGIRDLADLPADASYDLVADALSGPSLRPRALLDRFGIEVLATTDDPLDDLSAHRRIAADPTVRTRVLPTFRPDRYIDPNHPEFARAVGELAEAGGYPLDDYAAYLQELAGRRAHFIAHGAVSADHGVLSPRTADLDTDTAAGLYREAVRGTLDVARRRLFSAHMLFQMAEMSVRDGLVMTVHAGVLRNHHEPTWRALGPDTGHDIPVATTFTENLRPLLQAFGTAPGFHLILFTVDETAWSREIAPLAGFYPSVLIGAPWWFLDAPDAAQRFRAATVETAGFYRGSGFVDDTRAFLSIPARHDMARRSDAATLARMVVEGRVTATAAARVMADLVDLIPRRAFKL